MFIFIIILHEIFSVKSSTLKLKDTIEGNIQNTELTVVEANVQLSNAKTFQVDKDIKHLNIFKNLIEFF